MSIKTKQFLGLILLLCALLVQQWGNPLEHIKQAGFSSQYWYTTRKLSPEIGGVERETFCL